MREQDDRRPEEQAVSVSGRTACLPACLPACCSGRGPRAVQGCAQLLTALHRSPRQWAVLMAEMEPPPPQVPVLGQGRLAGAAKGGRLSAASRGSLSPTLSGWGSLAVSAEPDVSEELAANGAAARVAGSSPQQQRAAPPAKAATSKRRVAPVPTRQERGNRGAGLGGQDPEQEPAQSATARSQMSFTDVPHASQAAVDERAQRERQAIRHEKELRLARQHRKRKVLSRPAATIPSPRVGLCVAATEDSDAPAVRSSGPSVGGSTVGRTKKGPPHVLWVDRCMSLAQGGVTEEVSATCSALGRVGLVVRSYTDQRAALSWATHHKSQVACAVLHIQLADSRPGDHDVIKTCVGLKIPTVVLQLVPPGFNPSNAVRRAMEERSALCGKLGVAVASELNKAQAYILEKVSHKYEFGGNGQLLRLPTPTQEMPPWKTPPADNTNKLPPVNGAVSSTAPIHQPKLYRGPRHGKKGQYHLAPSNDGASTVRDNWRFCLRCFLAFTYGTPNDVRPPFAAAATVCGLNNVCYRVQVEYSYPEFRSVSVRHEQRVPRRPKARYEGAQIVTKNNRGDPSWSKPPESQTPRSVLVGAMRVAVPPPASDRAPLPIRTDHEVARSRDRLYTGAKTAAGAIDGATMKDLRSRFVLPPMPSQLQPGKPAG
eukprot:COSAG02_NODE_6113_length_3790_cov_6.285559_5_plen_656_part_00